MLLVSVALRKESVDRNSTCLQIPAPLLLVALRKESVDRNLFNSQNRHLAKQSLSARRAWIEIPAGYWRESRRAVALRKESVDRNPLVVGSLITLGGSLSARRAWIEIERLFIPSHWITCRSPQGERG